MFRIFERRILRRICGPINENCTCRSKYNHELYELYNEPDIAQSRAAETAGSPFRMQEVDST
jgi:hypothetical protein